MKSCQILFQGNRSWGRGKGTCQHNKTPIVQIGLLTRREVLRILNGPVVSHCYLENNDKIIWMTSTYESPHQVITYPVIANVN